MLCTEMSSIVDVCMKLFEIGIKKLKKWETIEKLTKATEWPRFFRGDLVFTSGNMAGVPPDPRKSGDCQRPPACAIMFLEMPMYGKAKNIWSMFVIFR